MDPFLGEIRAVPYTFAPQGWADCDGQLLSIAQNSALFSLIGTYYGGDGRSTFALPNLQGRVAVGQGGGPGLDPVQIGEVGGTAAVTLLVTQLPSHGHNVDAVTDLGNTHSPQNARFAVPQVQERIQNLYASTANSSALSAAVQVVGGSQPHNNMQPYLGMRYIIAIRGIYPARG